MRSKVILSFSVCSRRLDKEKNKFQTEVYELMSQLEGSNKDRVRYI